MNIKHLKKIFHSLLYDDISFKKRINIGNDFFFKIQRKHRRYLQEKSGFFYKILLNNKSKKPIWENFWSKKFSEINSLC